MKKVSILYLLMVIILLISCSKPKTPNADEVKQAAIAVFKGKVSDIEDFKFERCRKSKTPNAYDCYFSGVFIYKIEKYLGENVIHKEYNYHRSPFDGMLTYTLENEVWKASGNRAGFVNAQRKLGNK